MNLKFLFVVITLILGFHSGLKSQEPLTLGQAIELTLANNYQIRIADQNKTIANMQNTWGQAGLYPIITLGLTNTNAVQDNTKNPATFFPGRIFNTNLSASVDANWTIFSGFRVKSTKEQLEKIQEQSQGNAMLIVENAVQSTILSYYNALTQKRKLEIWEELLEFGNERIEYFETKQEVGVSNTMEVLQIKNQLLNDSTSYLMQKLQYENALRNLNLTMGQPIEIKYVLTDSLKISIPELDKDALRQEMLSNNTNIKNQLINMELQSINTKLARSALFPTVDLSAGASPSVGLIKVLPDVQDINSQQLQYYGNINIRYTLFNNYQNKRGVEVAQVREKIERLNGEELALQLNNELHINFEMFKQQIWVERISRENLSYADKVFEVGKDRYQLGSINYFDLNNLQNTYRNSMMLHYDNLYNLIASYVDILRLTGGIMKEDF